MPLRPVAIPIILFALLAAFLGFRLYENLEAARQHIEQIPAPAPRILATISFGKSRGGVITANPYTSQVFAAEEDVPALANIDARSGEIAHEIPLRGYHTGMTIDPIANEIYVAQEFSQSVRVVDGSKGKIAREIPVPGGSPIGELALDSDTNYLYVIQNDIQTVAILDYRDGALLGTIPIDAHYGDLTLNSQAQRLYVSSPLQDKVTVVDTSNNTIIKTIPVGKNPRQIAVNPATGRVYVAVANDNILAVIDGATNALVARIPVGDGPYDVAVNPVTNRVYVTNLTSNDLTIVDGRNNRVLTTIALGIAPGHIAILPELNRLYVASDPARGVLVIQDTSLASEHTTSLVSDESVRSFIMDTSSPPENWNQPDFDDSHWTGAVPSQCIPSPMRRPATDAKWIWLPGCSQYKESVLFRKVFDLPAGATQGVVRVRADEMGQVYLNGQQLGATRHWATEYWYDLTPHLRQGRNVLALRVNRINEGGYGAALFRADLVSNTP